MSDPVVTNGGDSKPRNCWLPNLAAFSLQPKRLLRAIRHIELVEKRESTRNLLQNNEVRMRENERWALKVSDCVGLCRIAIRLRFLRDTMKNRHETPATTPQLCRNQLMHIQMRKIMSGVGACSVSISVYFCLLFPH